MDAQRAQGDLGPLKLNLDSLDDESEWVTYTIPVGHEIVGLKCETSDDNMIRRIGFLLWIPNPDKNEI